MNARQCTVLATALCATLLLYGCREAAKEPALDSPFDVATALPPDGLERGWSRCAPVETFGPDNVYDYVNGEAPLYHSYNFRSLTHAVFCSDRPEGPSITIDIFETGSLLDGFGLYSRSRLPDREFRPIGTQGFLFDDTFTFWKGRFFVNVRADERDARLVSVAERFAKHVAANVPGSVAFPEEIMVFPSSALVRHSETYIGSNLLGYGFMGAGFTAKYRLGENDSTLFLVPFLNHSSALDGLDQYKAFLSEKGEQSRPVANLGATAVEARDPYLGPGFFCVDGRYLAGILNVDDRAAALALLRECLRNVASNEPA